MNVGVTLINEWKNVVMIGCRIVTKITKIKCNMKGRNYSIQSVMKTLNISTEDENL